MRRPSRFEKRKDQWEALTFWYSVRAAGEGRDFPARWNTTIYSRIPFGLRSRGYYYAGF